MAKKKKYGRKGRKSRRINPNVFNVHHLLWVKSYWSHGWARRLREHPYMKKSIPRDTLHRQIHLLIGSIPVPSEQECKKAYLVIEDRLAQGLISYDDTIAERIDLLLEVWKDCDDAWRLCALRKQKSVSAKFEGGRY